MHMILINSFPLALPNYDQDQKWGFCLSVLNKNVTKMPKITLKGSASEQSHWGCNVDKWHKG